MKTTRIQSFCNRLAMIIFAGAGLCSCFENKSEREDQNNLSDLDLSGSVISMTEITYSTRNKTGMDSTDEVISRIKYLFNKDGKIVERISYKKDSSRWVKTKYAYNHDGKIAGTETVDNDLDLLRKTVLKYNERGRLTEKINMNHVSELIDRETYRYYRKTNEVEKFIYRPASPSWNFYIYEDSNGGFKSENRHDISGPFVMKIISKNDRKGNRIEERYFKPDGSPGTKYLNKFDSRGNILETGVYDSEDTLLFKSVFKYDDSGNLIARYTDDQDEEMKLDASYAYDERGNMTEESSDFGHGLVRCSYSYAYDKTGNWVTRTLSEVSAKTGLSYSVILTKRQIEYYR